MVVVVVVDAVCTSVGVGVGVGVGELCRPSLMGRSVRSRRGGAGLGCPPSGAWVDAASVPVVDYCCCWRWTDGQCNGVTMQQRERCNSWHGQGDRQTSARSAVEADLRAAGAHIREESESIEAPGVGPFPNSGEPCPS